jgi:gamma-glutamyl-gamma-aminobutyrate hydrolase PuuD
VTQQVNDGFVEAVEHSNGWALGVQWHPEDAREVEERYPALPLHHNGTTQRLRG